MTIKDIVRSDEYYMRQKTLLEQTIENENLLIADFMGLSYEKDHSVTSNEKYWIYNNQMSDILRFDKSWDWLMPVVEKIEKMPTVRVVIKGSRCRILAGSKVFSCHTISKLNSMYRVVVDFIHWKNQNDFN